MISVSNSGIDAGALQPMGLDKQLRVQELALENKLPFVQLVESAGANLMAYRVEEFIRGGNLFRNLARMSAAGLPVVTVTHGSSTAGGAYQTGLSDYIVMVRNRTRAFLAGPPLLKAATGEEATEEQLGGAEMHTSISGLGDYLAEDDRDAIRIAREILAQDRLEQGRAGGAGPCVSPTPLRSRRPAWTHADGLSAPVRHERDRSPGSPTIPTSSNSRRTTEAQPSAATSGSKAGRSGSSPTTARSIRLARTRRRTSSRPAASRARRSST